MTTTVITANEEMHIALELFRYLMCLCALEVEVLAYRGGVGQPHANLLIGLGD